MQNMFMLVFNIQNYLLIQHTRNIAQDNDQVAKPSNLFKKSNNFKETI